MTWGEFVNSEYNTVGLIIKSSDILNSNGEYIVTLAGPMFEADRTIKSTDTYTFEDYNSGYETISEEEFRTTIANAENGDVIDFEFSKVVLTEPITLDKDITIERLDIIGSSVYITAQNVELVGVDFYGLNNDNEKQESYIYALNYGGNLKINSCGFYDTEYAAIEITPINGANISITTTSFNSYNKNQQRYIDIQGSGEENVDCTIEISALFTNLEYLDITQGKGEAVKISNCNLNNVTFNDNYISGKLTEAELKAKISISNEEPWTTSDSLLETNTFTSKL